MLTPDIARMIMSNFDEFYRRGSFGGEHFTEDGFGIYRWAGIAGPLAASPDDCLRVLRADVRSVACEPVPE